MLFANSKKKKLIILTDRVLAKEKEIASLNDEALIKRTEKIKKSLNNGESPDLLLHEAFAIFREASWRVLGLKHFPVQIMGGVALFQGNIIEMKTGEGKTITAALPAYLYSLTGKKVHIVTVNEYLTRRDSQQIGMVFAFLGLSVGAIYYGQTIKEKQAAYNCDITYGTNKEFIFDYLKDNMAKSKDEIVQAGLHFAIVDEADSVLIDEARTPLIISGAEVRSPEFSLRTDAFVRTLKEEHYDLDKKEKTIALSEEGIAQAEQFFNIKNLASPKHAVLRHYISVALQAHHLAMRDTDYIVKNDKIILVDQFTGRLVPGKVFRDGLQQAIEIKEGVKINPENMVVSTMSQQNFFRGYEKLAGMTGTALSEQEEFRHIYGLETIEIPTNKPMVRIDYPDKVFKTEKEKWDAIIEDISFRYRKKQPVLIGTTNIEKSEMLSKKLLMHGIPHSVLNAKNDEHEANIIACAGQLGNITVATNMAGRGTDIVLGGNPHFRAQEVFFAKYKRKPQTMEDYLILGNVITEQQLSAEKERAAVLKVGGLCVIGTERHESRRIDNQLRGRAGRQGDAGESQFYLSLEDDLLRYFGGERVKIFTDNLKLPEGVPISNKFLNNIIEQAQKLIENLNFNKRKSLIQFDDVVSIQRSLIYKDRKKIIDADYTALLDHINSLTKPEGKNNLSEERLRKLILTAVDACWAEHIDNISQLKQGLALHIYGRENPIEVFKKEAFLIYQEMINNINDRVISSYLVENKAHHSLP